jgi:HK97 gp10 family phage protein
MVSATVQVKIDKASLLLILDKADKLTDEAADIMAAEMKKSITSGPKSGRRYGNHISSAPGQSPANWTGALVKSIKVQKEKHKSIVSIGKKYAEYLEFGTSKMAPRPFIIPAFLYTKKWFSNSIKRLSK